MSRTLFLSLFFLLSILLGCQQAPPPNPLQLVLKGDVTYQERGRKLKADLTFFRATDSMTLRPYLPAPSSVTFLGSAMESLRYQGNTRFRTERQVNLPDSLRVSFRPDSLGQEDFVQTAFAIPVASVDSFPAGLSQTAQLRFSLGGPALREGESLVLFFEPADRGRRPHRILVAGPTKSDLARVPISALTTVPPGEYAFYLVRQGRLSVADTPSLRSEIEYNYFSQTKAVTVLP